MHIDHHLLNTQPLDHVDVTMGPASNLHSPIPSSTRPVIVHATSTPSSSVNVDSTCIETVQRNDTELCQLINFVLVGQHPPQNQVMSWSPYTKAIHNQFDRLIINQQNILCRVYVNIGSHDTLQVIIPRSIRKQFRYQLHLMEDIWAGNV
jgi:hypothetical protein